LPDLEIFPLSNTEERKKKASHRDVISSLVGCSCANATSAGFVQKLQKYPTAHEVDVAFFDEKQNAERN
jgi:hypothetical protein